MKKTLFALIALNLIVAPATAMDLPEGELSTSNPAVQAAIASLAETNAAVAQQKEELAKVLEELNTAFCNAVSNNDRAFVEQALEVRPDIAKKATTIGGVPALLCAVIAYDKTQEQDDVGLACAHLDTIKFLVNNGACMHKKIVADGLATSAYSYALARGLDPVVEFFLNRGASLTMMQDVEQLSPIVYALTHNSISTVELLKKRGATFDHLSSADIKALQDAFSSKSISNRIKSVLTALIIYDETGLLKELLPLVPSSLEEDIVKYYLMLAIREELKPNLVCSLINKFYHGPRIAAQLSKVLFAAVIAEDKETCLRILQHNPSKEMIESTDEQGRTLLTHAVCAPGFTPVVEKLIELGCPIDQRTGSSAGNTPLTLAIRMHRKPAAGDPVEKEIALALIRAGANSNITVNDRCSALEFAARRHSALLVQELITHNANVNNTSAIDTTPLSAALEDTPETELDKVQTDLTLALLLASGAKTGNNRALRLKVKTFPLAKLVLEKKCPAGILTLLRNDLDAVTVENSGNDKVVTVGVEGQGSMNKQTPLMIAASLGNVPMVEHMLSLHQ